MGDIKKVKCGNPECKKLFVKSRNGAGNQRYCCPECKKHAAYLRDVANPNLYKKPNHCKYCGTEFFGGGNFCSQDCRVIHTNIIKNEKKRAEQTKRGLSPLAVINKLARAEGLSYGKYLARHGYDSFSYIK